MKATRLCPRCKRFTVCENVGPPRERRVRCTICGKEGVRPVDRRVTFSPAKKQRIRAAVRAWHRRGSGGKFTTVQRDLLLSIGYLAPIVKPLPKRRRA